VRRLASISLLLAVVVSLGSPASRPAPAAAGVAAPAANGSTATASRPYGLKVPKGYDGQRPTPLVVLLHGYTSNGSAQNAYFKLGPLADGKNFLLAYPDGTVDLMGNRFWNATDACCDFFNSGVDDVGYIDAVINEIAGRYNVDQARIYLVGHSNGAFMAHRFACDHARRIAAIVTLAGMQWKDAMRCPASSPVSVLHVHGRDDETIHYEGGSTPRASYPGAVETVGAWAAKDGCTGSLTATGQRLDLDASVPGEETTIERYPSCAGVDVELWTINGGRHVPAFNDHWAEAIWDFLAGHRQTG
jgi:polyhydroxybutyrate depolymerase